MKNSFAIDSYEKFYSDMNFERPGLFEIVKNKYSCTTVIYPGCSFHITPSFYFQHVIYVDISEAAKSFFDDIQGIQELINRHKKYKQSPYFQFLNSDYTKQLPVRENDFDLLIAIYAGGISQSCKRYLKPGGIIVTNNHHNDAKQVLTDSSIVLDALIRKKGNQYELTKSSDDNLTKILERHHLATKNMKNTNQGMEYVDNECYFIIKKLY